MSLNSLLLILLTLLINVVPLPGRAIVGGSYSDKADWPFLVRLGTECAAAKVKENLLLTAGHCIPFIPGQGLKFDVRWVNINSSAKAAEPAKDKLEVLKIYIPEGFFKKHGSPELPPENWGRDVALIEVLPTEAFKEIPILELATEPIQLGQEVRIAGWGERYDRLNTTEEIELVESVFKRHPHLKTDLKEAQTRIRLILPNYFELTEVNDQGTAARSALGDSGGPALVRESDGHWRLAGVTAFRMEGGGNMHYTRTSSFEAWLEEIAAGKVDPIPLAP